MKNLILGLLACFIFMNLCAQNKKKPTLEFFGHVMTDMGYNFNQINPDYADAMRPTQLPSFKNEFGTDGNVFFSARQSMFSMRSTIPTEKGDLKLDFGFDLYGLGNNEGETAFHMLHAYGELGMIGVGHTWSLFSDIDGFPNMVDYWGPVGMSLCKSVQLRFIPFNGKNRLAFALEGPGASADEGIYEDRIELDNVKAKFNLPDFSSEFRITRKWGYVEIAGILRKIEWIDQNSGLYDLSGKTIGWGLNLSTNLKLSENSMLIGQTSYGKGSQNYMNDAPTDIAIENDFDNKDKPIKGVALPYYAYSLYFNHYWNEKFSSTIGYSAIYTDNSNGQKASAFRNGGYSSTNLLYYPTKNIMAGIEFQWINRENYNDDWKTSATKIQISIRYKFSHLL